jgi:hypothetical protein
MTLIYYVYERGTGNYAGSGTAKIENETHASTTVKPLATDDKKFARFDAVMGTWSLVPE